MCMMFVGQPIKIRSEKDLEAAKMFCESCSKRIEETIAAANNSDVKEVFFE